MKNKSILITGANGALGTYVTQAFLDAGARVAGASRRIQGSEFPSPNFRAMPAEISTLDAARGLVASVVTDFGRIDALVHLVGGFAGGPTIAESDDATLERMIDMNFRSAYHMIRAVLPGMRSQGSGRILAIGARPASEPVATLGLYSASKAALVSLVKTVAIENKDRGISANIVLPGTMDTPANRSAMPGADASQWVSPAQVAALLVYLASDQGSNISGAAIPILGGGL